MLKYGTVTYADLIKFYGSQTEAAKALHLSQPAVWEWQHNTIPYDRQCQIEVDSAGKLRADRKHDARLKRKAA